MPVVEVFVQETNFGDWRKNIQLDFIPTGDYCLNISEDFPSIEETKFEYVSFYPTCVTEIRIGKPALITVSPIQEGWGSEDDTDVLLADLRRLYMKEVGWEEVK